MMYLIKYSEGVTTFTNAVTTDVNSNFITAMETDNGNAKIKSVMKAAYKVL